MDSRDTGAGPVTEITALRILKALQGIELALDRLATAYEADEAEQLLARYNNVAPADY